MSYASYSTIQSLNTFADALKHISNTTPIRGSHNVIPLGARRYHNEFSIRQTKTEVIQCLLGDHPLVTFARDQEGAETITITSGGRTRSGSWVYSDVREAYFIKNLLRHYVADAVMHKRTLRLTLVDGRKVGVRAGEPLVATPSGRCLTFVSDVRMRGWRLDRKACNSVRKQYGAFYRYVKGMVSLRKEDLRTPFNNLYKGVITIASTEMGVALEGTASQWSNASRISVIRPNPAFLTKKPMIGEVQKESWSHEKGMWDKTPVNLYANWVQNVEGLLTFVRDEGETQHESWHKAFLMLAYSVNMREIPNDFSNPKAGSVYICYAADVLKVLDEIIFKWHSKEVFEMVTLEPGQVPNPAYESWVDRYPKDTQGT
jgi:hypothetical protein